MNELREWALCLVIGAMAGTFVVILSPRGSMNKAVRAVTGIFIVATMCSPLSRLLEKDISINALAYSVYDEDNADEMNGYITETFQNEIEKHILSLAEMHNIEIKEIYINVDINTDNCIIIHEISVEVKSMPDDGVLMFSKKLSEEFGVNIAVNSE